MNISRHTAGAALLLAALASCGPAVAQTGLACGAFTRDVIVPPEPREAASVLQRFEGIKAKVQSHSYQVVFLGDSLTHRWDEVAEDHRIWEKNFDRFDALNAGVNGDRTEHLLWRIENGNLDKQRPSAVVLLIGTNDLGHDRPPDQVAEGIRRILTRLMEMRPERRILLEGLWPRTDRAKYGAEIDSVNRKIKQCADNIHIIYTDPGHLLLDTEGHLPRDLAPDGLHPSPAGYEIVSAAIAKALTPLVTAH